MSRYTVRHEHLGPWPVLALIDTDSGMAVRIARRGATLLDFLLPVQGRLRDVADGYADAGELEALEGSRFAIMVPFANRVADARYTFAGQEHDLQPGVDEDRGIMHGFVRAAEFDLVSQDVDDTGACVRLGCRALRPGVHPGYPFALDLEVAFTLHARGLDLAVTMHNAGAQPAPCFFGWHPYLRLREDGVDACELHLPARQAIMVDRDLIPLPGAAAFRPLDDCPELDFRHPRRIGQSVLDNGFADRVADPDGRFRTHLRDPDSGLALSMWQDAGVTQVYTADTLHGAAVRRSVAIEPMQAMTDAFHRPDCADAITLAAGADRHFHCGLEAHLP